MDEVVGKGCVEEWRRVVGFGDEYYEVSSEGRYRSLDRYVPNAWGNGLRLLKGRVKKLHRRGRYLFASLTVDRELRSVYIHRLVAMAFPDICGEWFEGCQVDHIDGNVDNNKATNLLVCTAKQNMNNPLTKQHISAATKRVIKEKGHPLKGKHHSEETKRKISESARIRARRT